MGRIVVLLSWVLTGPGCDLVCPPNCGEVDRWWYETYCGDTLLSDAEECDGPELGLMTCLDLGYAGGSLACYDNCSFDTSGCTRPASGSFCAQCGADVDCPFPPYRCLENRCIGCLTDGDCDSTQTCIDAWCVPSFVCDPACAETQVCAGFEGCLDKCTGDYGSGGAAPCGPTTPLCQLPAGECVLCRADADCPGQPFQGCNTLNGTCSRCLADDECAAIPGFPRCNDGICTMCNVATAAADCGNGYGDRCGVDHFCSCEQGTECFGPGVVGLCVDP